MSVFKIFGDAFMDSYRKIGLALIDNLPKYEEMKKEITVKFAGTDN